MEKSDPLRQLMLAAVLLTRLPLPALPSDAFQNGHKAVWAYPVVGLGIGAIGALIGMLAMAAGLPLLAAAALAMGAMICVTGAMHEDGLADLCDGFWGGFTPARRLEIMRDSQIGTYGVLALISSVLLRLSAIMVLLDVQPVAIIAAAALSRGLMPALMTGLPPARTDGLSQSVGRPSWPLAGASAGIGLAVALICLGAAAVAGICAAIGIAGAVALLAKAKIGGQTGDVLGAVQQLSEIAFLLSVAAVVST